MRGAYVRSIGEDAWLSYSSAHSCPMAASPCSRVPPLLQARGRVCRRRLAHSPGMWESSHQQAPFSYPVEPQCGANCCKFGPCMLSRSRADAFACRRPRLLYEAGYAWSSGQDWGGAGLMLLAEKRFIERSARFQTKAFPHHTSIVHTGE